MSVHTKAVVVCDPHGRPLIDKFVKLNANDATGPRTGWTNEDGYIKWDDFPDTVLDSDLSIWSVGASPDAPPEYLMGLSGANRLSPTNQTIRVGGTALPGDVRLPAFVVHSTNMLDPLVIGPDGRDFVNADGQRRPLAGVDGFLDYRIWLDQRESGLDPFMAEAIDLGMVNDHGVRRIFLAGSKNQNGVLDLFPQHEPEFYSQLKTFVAYQNSHGCIPLLTVNVDMQDVMLNQEDRINNWHRINEELRGFGLVYLMSGGNEHDKNGWDPNADIDNPGEGVIWSRGSSLEDTKTPPNGAPASELHSTRIGWPDNVDRPLMDAAASPPDMRQHGSTMVWMTEGVPFNNDSNSFYAWQLGRVYATCWALAIFHNRQGQGGQLLGDGTRECLSAFSAGMRT